jgi:hypothetical protein
MEPHNTNISNYRLLTDSDKDFGDFETWDAKRLGTYFHRRGLDYREQLVEHKITGALAPLLTDTDLKELGIHIIGDRLLFRHLLQELSRHQRFQRSLQPYWQGQEHLFPSPCARTCWTVCGLCPVDPTMYKLTSHHLKVRKVVPVRCGPFRLSCCGFGSTLVSHSIDLSKVDDVDVSGQPAPCIGRLCCNAKGQDIIEVESRFERGSGGTVASLGNEHHHHNKITLVLAEGDGEAVSQLILHRIQESQQQSMDRS